MKVVFLLRPTDGRARVWRQRNTSFQDNHMLGTTAFEGGGVTVWGCFSFDCKLDLYVLDCNLTGQKYRDCADIAGHGIVWTASCCKKCCTIRALCGLALSSMNIGPSVNAWLSTHKTSTVNITSSPCSIWLVTWSFGVDYSHMETGPLVWWKSFFVTP
jgi:hypothetical protein